MADCRGSEVDCCTASMETRWIDEKETRTFHSVDLFQHTPCTTSQAHPRAVYPLHYKGHTPNQYELWLHICFKAIHQKDCGLCLLITSLHLFPLHPPDKGNPSGGIGTF